MTSRDKKYIPKFPVQCNIGIDVDGVIGDIMSSVIEKSNKHFDINILQEQLVSPDLSSCTDLSQEQTTDLFTKYHVFQDMELIKGAKVFITKLHRKKYSIYIFTDRFWSNDDWSNTTNWLKMHHIPYKMFTLLKAKHRLDFAKIHNLDIIIEDYLETAKELASFCKLVILLDAPYNQGTLPNNVRRVRNWEEAFNEIVSL